MILWVRGVGEDGAGEGVGEVLVRWICRAILSYEDSEYEMTLPNIKPYCIV